VPASVRILTSTSRIRVADDGKYCQHGNGGLHFVPMLKQKQTTTVSLS